MVSGSLSFYLLVYTVGNENGNYSIYACVYIYIYKYVYIGSEPGLRIR